MARKPRLHLSGGLYHVILRGNARQDVFFSPADRHFFYELLAEGVVRFGYRVHAFCLGLALVRYLHLNPVRARMVKQAGAYAWSSQRAYLGEEAFLNKVLPRREAKLEAPSLKRIVAYVCDGYGLTEGALQAPGQGRQTASPGLCSGFVRARWQKSPSISRAPLPR